MIQILVLTGGVDQPILSEKDKKNPLLRDL